MAESPPRGKRKKRALKVFEVMTRIDMDEKTARQYALNEQTNEVYRLKSQCGQCGSVESEEDVNESQQHEKRLHPDVSSSADDSRLQRSSSSSSLAKPAHMTRKEYEWLKESDYDEIIKLREGEVSHQRRLMRDKEEITTRKVRNKLSMLGSLRLHTTTQNVCSQLITAAIEAERVSVNVNAFVIMEDGTLRVYNPQSGGCHYELVHNKHVAQTITKQQLFEDMIRHQDNTFKELIHIFRYLEEASPPREYIIYKRKIELVDGALVDHMDWLQKLEKLFEPTREGYYYAIIVCLGFSLMSNNVKEVTKTRLVTKTKSMPISPPTDSSTVNTGQWV